MLHKVTALKVQQRRKDKVNVFLDGEYAFSLASILAIRLRTGQELSDQQIKELLHQHAVEETYQRALHYLSFRARSESEMQRYLRHKDADEETIKVVLDRLREHGLVDDGEFARSWVASRESSRPRGLWGLRAELRQKGVTTEIIESALGSVDEQASAMQAASDVARRLAHLDKAMFFRRLLSYLQRRGFGYEVSRRAVDHYWRELNRASPDDDV